MLELLAHVKASAAVTATQSTGRAKPLRHEGRGDAEGFCQAGR
jgi:hypothetical protein